MNTIIELLNAAGYINSNTNRERAVRNMNLLIDSGIMSLTLIPAEAYNAKENGKGFWMMCEDGKKRPTAALDISNDPIQSVKVKTLKLLEHKT